MAYNVAETTNVSGKCFDFIYDQPIENGSIVAKGDIVDGERNIYKAKIPAAGDEVFLVAQPAWSYDDSSSVNQNEDNFICPANKPFRVYGLLASHHDKFAVADYGITTTDDIAIAVGDYVTADGTTVKIKDAGTTAPATTAGFVGKVTEIVPYGMAFYSGSAGVINGAFKQVVIEVIKNETV